MVQLLLPFHHEKRLTHENFFPSACNRLAYDMVMRWPEWESPFLRLQGKACSGKTHLAHIWMERSGALLLPKNTEEFFESFAGDGQKAFVADDMLSYPEELLFHLYNHISANGGYVLLTTKSDPTDERVTLPDLRSRLISMPEIGIDAPDDMLLQMLLTKELSDRQLRVPPAVVNYIMCRIERSFSAIYMFVSRLDRASMEEKRNITVPFVKSILDA